MQQEHQGQLEFIPVIDLVKQMQKLGCLVGRHVVEVGKNALHQIRPRYDGLKCRNVMSHHLLLCYSWLTVVSVEVWWWWPADKSVEVVKQLEATSQQGAGVEAGCCNWIVENTSETFAGVTDTKLFVLVCYTDCIWWLESESSL